MVENEKDPAFATALQPLLDQVAVAKAEKRALLRRSWTDEAFQEGEEKNEERVEGFEEELARMIEDESFMHHTRASWWITSFWGRAGTSCSPGGHHVDNRWSPGWYQLVTSSVQPDSCQPGDCLGGFPS